MSTLAGTSLLPEEHALLERFATRLGERLGDDLRSIWLFGSRARGEPPGHEDSDVDLLVLVSDASWEGKQVVGRVFHRAADELGLQRLTPWFSVHIQTEKWLAGRRAIESFFIAEVDRDKVVIRGAE